ncbi:MAG: MoaD/ThiS family protein [Proteobacteria bacterium]|nr:MAG: MoaD/ThiS family protein [Pseudomonadota bacterium]
MSRDITVRYFASLKEKAGQSSEALKTSAVTASDLYRELKERHGFPLDEQHLKVSINREYKPFTTAISSGDEVVFIPPVSGG